jgi:hypothetical protein
MSGAISYYFTLFKKFQVINHVPEGTVHGAGVGGFNLSDPTSVFGNSNKGSLLGATINPADSPLWAILNSRAGGSAAFSPVTVGGTQWPTMPADPLPQAWNDLQVAASPKLVDVFGSWIGTSKVSDIPAGVIASKPAAIAATDPGVITPFVCSMPGDQGIRPDGVPGNFWATSLIFLVDPTTGATVLPTTLTAGSEYYLTAIIGNRGAQNSGIYNNPAATGIEASAAVMVWNTFDSPGVQLPALSNLDVNDKNGIYPQYFLNAGQYDVVGFRMNVQTVYDGIIAALNNAVANGLNLAGLTPDQWVKAQPAHLCSKVVVRLQGGSFPNLGDVPTSNARIAQKNLAPFDINITALTPDPNINWKNFIVGQPLFLRLEGAGRSRITLDAKLPENAFKLYLGIPKQTFEQHFANGRKGGIKGFRRVPTEELCESKLGDQAKPFPEAVVLEWQGGENRLEFPPLPEGQYLGMSLGIEYSVKKIKPGVIGEVNLVQHTLMPRLKPGTRCFDIEEVVAGGFTILVRALAQRSR